MNSSGRVFASKVLAITVLCSCALVLGFFVLMAESGGKDSRPDVLLPLVLSIGVLAFGVRRQTIRRGTVTILVLGAATLGPSPLLLDYLISPGRGWPMVFAIPWWMGLATTLAAALLSRAAGPPADGSDPSS